MARGRASEGALVGVPGRVCTPNGLPNARSALVGPAADRATELAAAGPERTAEFTDISWAERAAPTFGSVRWPGAAFPGGETADADNVGAAWFVAGAAEAFG